MDVSGSETKKGFSYCGRPHRKMELVFVVVHASITNLKHIKIIPCSRLSL